MLTGELLYSKIPQHQRNELFEKTTIDTFQNFDLYF